jgi:hypothetical protein
MATAAAGTHASSGELGNESGAGGASQTVKLGSVKGVVDLTFLDIKDEALLALNLNDKVQRANFTLTSISNSTTGAGSESPSKTKSQPEIKAIRLSNNLITDTAIIVTPIMRCFDTSKILWLDLSFNHITTISASLATQFPNITTLYLQANQISKLTEIKKLGSLTKLKSLALYGNPLEENKHYKNFTLYICQKVTYFDNSTVTKQDRQKIDIFGQTYRKKLHPEDYE